MSSNNDSEVSASTANNEENVAEQNETTAKRNLEHEFEQSESWIEKVKRIAPALNKNDIKKLDE